MGKNRVDVPACAEGVVTLETRIQILLEEYRALYSLLTFRLAVIDRRLPAIGGTLAAALGGTAAMPDETRLVFLLSLPLALVWLFLSTVQHTRSKEDHVRRIDEIERLVNRLTGEELLVFQSRHPSKGRQPGGRTGFSSVLALLAVCLIMLLTCACSIRTHLRMTVDVELPMYDLYLSGCALMMLVATIRLSRYRYRRQPPDAPAMFEARDALISLVLPSSHQTIR